MPTLDGPVKHTLKRGTQSGEVVRIAGRGMPQLRSGRPGDLLVQVVVETPHATMRARARLNPALAHDVLAAQFGWWKGCDALGLAGYDAEGNDSANYNNLIDATAGDPISGTMALRSSLCEVRRA